MQLENEDPVSEAPLEAQEAFAEEIALAEAGEWDKLGIDAPMDLVPASIDELSTAE